MRKTLSFILSVLLLLTNGVFAYSAETNFWKSRRAPVQMASASPFSLPLAEAPALAPRPLPALLNASGSTLPTALKTAYMALPHDVGTVRKILIPSHPNGQVVVYVQDVHGNAEAQQNIATALTALEKRVPVGVLALEGTAGPVNLEPFRDFPAGAVKEAVGRRMVDENRMSGAALAAWNAPTAGPTTVGVDETALHRQNVTAYLQARSRRDVLHVRLAATERDLAARKKSLFSPELAAFDAAVEAHRAGTAPLSAYAREIDKRRSTVGGEIAKFILAYRFESVLDFKRVESERETLLKRLVAKLTDARARTLLELGLAYKSGQVTAGEFNAALGRLCAEAGVPLSQFPQMKAYLDYVRISDDIDVEKLSLDLASEEDAIYARLASRPEEKNLVESSRSLFLTGGLLDFSLSRDEWNEYKALIARNGTGLDASWQTALAPFEDFYRYAELRDRALTGHVLDQLARRDVKTAVVVTGGFHSTGVEQRLLQAGVSIIRFTPKVTKVESDSTVTALSAFAQEKTPLEKIFEGRSLFLSPDPFPLETRREAALDLTGGRALTEHASPAELVGWLGRAVPVWTSVKAAVVAGLWHVSGVEKRGDDASVPFSVDVDADGSIHPTGVSAPGFVERLAAILAKAAVVRPIIETAGLLALHAGFMLAFPGSAALAPAVIGLIFAAIHPSVYFDEDGHRRPVLDSIAHFAVLAVLGAVFVSLLNQPYGVARSLSLHMAYNAAVAAAKTVVKNGHEFPNPFAPTLLMATPDGAVIPVSSSIAIAPASITGRILSAVASLPLAMVARGTSGRPTRTFEVGRTNNVEKIVKARVLRIDGATAAPAAPAKVYPKLTDDQVEPEIQKIAAAKKKFQDTLDYDDAAAVETYEKMFMWFLTAFREKQIIEDIRTNRKPAAQAVRDAAEAVIAEAKATEKPAQEEWGQAGLAFADALDVRTLSDDEIEPEVKSLQAKQDEISGSLDYDDAAAVEAYEKIMMFMSAKGGEIAADIRKNRRPAAEAIREVAQAFITQAKEAGRPAHEELGLAGMSFADRFDQTAKEEPADPLDDVTSPVVLVVRNPDLHQMIRFIADPLNRVAAVVLDGPYESKHWSAFMAQTRGIPVLGDLRGETTQGVYDSVEDGDVVFVDSINQTVVTNPSTRREAGFERDLEEQTASLEVLSGWGNRPSVTKDGVPIKVSAVAVDFPTSQKEITAINRDADGNIGLFRMEFLFANEIPANLDQKFETMGRNLKGYIRVRAVDRRPGDKNTVFDKMPGNDKAELHWLLETETGEQTLRNLIRSLLVAQYRLPVGQKNLEFFVPMVESAAQAQKVLDIIAEVRAEVRTALSVPADDPLKLRFGVMIEKPLAPEVLDQIAAVEGVDFISIGTRDMAEATKVRDVTHRDYLDAIRNVVLAAVKHGKEISLCGEHTSNEALLLYVNSLNIPDDKLPSWAVVQLNIPRIKGVIRGTTRSVLKSFIKGGTNKRKIERMVRAARQNAEAEILRSAEFEEAFHRVLVAEGAKEAVERDYNETTDRRLGASVKAEVVSGKVSRDKAAMTGYDFSLINALSRHALSALHFTGTNGNRVLGYLTRLAQNWIDRVVFSKDSRDRWTIVGAEGHRPGKDTQGTLPVGALLGYGQKPREMLLLSMETPAGLYTENGEGTILGRIYGDEGTILPMPDAYMFKVATSKRLAGLPVAEVVERAREDGRDDISLSRAASELMTLAEQQLKRKPRVAVLLRDRQRGLIEAIAARLGLPDSYTTIQARVEASRDGHVEFTAADGGVLSVYRYDDWSSGLSFTGEKGLDLMIGTGGTPEATMSAAVAKKLDGHFLGVLVPANGGMRFTAQERATFARAGITDPTRLYTEDDLVPGAADDVAVGVAVLRDFRIAGQPDTVYQGPVVRDDGHVTATVLWVGPNGVMPVKITYPLTTLTLAIRKAKKEPTNDEAAFNLALAWTDFGQYEKAMDVIKQKSSGAKDSTSQKKWKALKLFIEANIILTTSPDTTEDHAVLTALAKFEEALPILDDAGLNELRGQLAVRQRVRRLYYWLRDKAFRERRIAEPGRRDELFHAAAAYAAKAFSYTTRGYETRRRENNVRLDGITERYDSLEATHWATTRQRVTESHGLGAAQVTTTVERDVRLPENKPDLTARLGFAYDSLKTEKDNPNIVRYAEELLGRETNLLTVVLFGTALREDPLDEQARILRFLSRSADFQTLANRIANDATLRRHDAIAQLASLIEAGRKGPSWQSEPLHSLPGERRAVRPEIREFLPEMNERPYAHAVLMELILASMAKADVMGAVGNKDRVRPYLEEAVQYAEVMELHPRLLGNNPLSVILDLSQLYQDAAAVTGDAAQAEKAKFYAGLIQDGDRFAEFLRGLKDEEGQRVYPDGPDAAHDNVTRWNNERAALAGEQVAFLTERAMPAPRTDAPSAASAAPAADESGTPPAVNSLPYYLALLWNRVATPRWQIQNPERWISRGYAIEITLGIAAILLAVLLPGASHTAFFVGATPVTGLAAATLAVVAVYAVLHAAAWTALMLLDRRVSLKEVSGRLGVHFVGFLPYVLLAQAAALHPGLNAGVVVIAVFVALWHIAFDETLSKSVEDLTTMTPAQQARYEAILDALNAREAADGTLSRRIDSLAPLSAEHGVTPAAFARALDVAARRAAKARPASLDQTVDAALRASSDGPIIVFVSANGPSGQTLVNDAFARAKAEGRNRPVLVAIDPDVPGADALVADIARLQDANPAISSSVRRLGSDVMPRGGVFHYEDLLAAFALDTRVDARARLMLQSLATGRIAGGSRIVQINASAQRFVGRPDLLALILLILPDVKGNSVLLDLKSVMLAAQQA